jgi:hypothetical protein
MIVNHPTGLYASALPSIPTDTTSVVYTCSGDIPSLRIAPFIALPEGIRKQPKGDKIYIDTERRAAVGDLVFATSTHVESKIRTGLTTYVMNQVLEFNAAVDTGLVVPNFVGKSVATQHNLARLDTDAIGIEDLLDTPAGTGETLDEAAIDTYNILRDQITELQTQYDNLQADIDRLKKSINETDRAINAINVVIATNDSQSLVDTRDQLEANKQAMITQLEEDIDAINVIPSKLSVLRDQLNNVAILIQ